MGILVGKDCQSDYDSVARCYLSIIRQHMRLLFSGTLLSVVCYVAVIFFFVGGARDITQAEGVKLEVAGDGGGVVHSLHHCRPARKHFNEANLHTSAYQHT